MKVWVLTITDRHGAATRVYATEDLAISRVFEYVKENWDPIILGEPSENRDSAIRAYWDYAQSRGDDCKTEEISVEGHKPPVVTVAIEGGMVQDVESESAAVVRVLDFDEPDRDDEYYVPRSGLIAAHRLTTWTTGDETKPA